MNFRDSHDQAVLRQAIRRWLAENVDDTRHDRLADESEYLREWQRLLYEQGFVGVSWPKQYGGSGLGLIEEQVVLDEMVKAGAPRLINIAGLFMVGPTLMRFGTVEQQARYLRPILTADEVWCQGFSEPGAGSDLASLRSTASPQPGGGFRITGHKVWVSEAQRADQCLLLARTDPTTGRHSGISCFLVDMNDPGITVRPIVDLAGSSEFAEVMFDDVEVPNVALCGGLHDGWRIAMAILNLERRLTMRAHGVHPFAALRRLLSLAHSRRAHLSDVELDQIGRVVATAYAARTLRYRNLTLIEAGQAIGPEASLEKLLWDSLAVDVHRAGLSLDEPAPISDDYWTLGTLDSVSHSIAGGTTEIQKNTVAERLLGLPKD